MLTTILKNYQTNIKHVSNKKGFHIKTALKCRLLSAIMRNIVLQSLRNSFKSKQYGHLYIFALQ